VKELRLETILLFFVHFVEGRLSLKKKNKCRKEGEMKCPNCNKEIIPTYMGLVCRTLGGGDYWRLVHCGILAEAKTLLGTERKFNKLFKENKDADKK
jgi:hypothetical protein